MLLKLVTSRTLASRATEEERCNVQVRHCSDTRPAGDGRQAMAAVPVAPHGLSDLSVDRSSHTSPVIYARVLEQPRGFRRLLSANM